MATNKLIDLSRLSRFWDKVKNYIDSKLTNLPEAQGGTDNTFVTTGDKYNWNHNDASNKVSKSGDTMTGDLKWEINGRQGIAWKEYGYGDKFEIRPYFAGADDSNYLAIQTATGGAGTDPGTTEKFKFYPSGNSMFLGNATSYNYTAACANSPAFISKVTNVDASKSNNNISSGTYYPCWNAQDSSGRILSRLESVISSNGSIGTYLYVRNYNTSGTQVAQKGISMSMDKSGNLTYSVSDPVKWRNAVPAGNYSSGSPSGNLRFHAETSLVGMSGTTGTLVSSATLNTIFGVNNSGASNTAVFVSNGDESAYTGLVSSCAFRNNSWHVRVTASVSGNIRVNWFAVYFG